MHFVSGKEWRRVWIYAVVIIVLTLLPYLVGWSAAGDAWAFNGFAFAVDDGNAYLGKMRIGLEGGWAFFLFFSPEETESAFGLYVPHILIGQFMRVIGADSADALAVAFQAFRIVGAFLMICAIYRFTAEFVRTPRTRFLILLVATLGGGLGWLLTLLGQTDLLGSPPVDFLVPEGHSFLVIFGLPHIAMGRAAMLAGFVALFVALRRNDWRYAVVAGLLWNVVGLMVTFYLAVLYALLGAWGLVLWVRERRFPLHYTLLGGLATIITAPLFLYSAWLFTQNDAFAQWSAQNSLPSPHPVHYVLGYGLLAIPAVIGIRWAWRHDTPAYALLIGWVMVTPILVYLPLNVQRRLAEGVLIPLAILAMVGLRLVWRQRARWILVAVLPTSLLLWMVGLFGLANPDYPTHRPQAEIAAMDWLAEQEPGIVMGDFTTGNYVPIRMGLDFRPFWAHGPETLYSDDKEALTEQYYRGELSAAERTELYQTYNIRYVMYGTQERELGNMPWNRQELAIIYNQDAYIIYEVQ